MPLGDQITLGCLRKGGKHADTTDSITSGLIFVSATDDARFRAFDLPGAAEATPITYEARDGKQYVVITATGGGFFNNPVTSDTILAYTLE